MLETILLLEIEVLDKVKMSVWFDWSETWCGLSELEDPAVIFWERIRGMVNNTYQCTLVPMNTRY